MAKERQEIDERYQWDLTGLYENDEKWEEAFGALSDKLAACTAFRGRLKDEESILAYLQAETDLELLLSDLFTYASLRKSEDNRAEAAQSIYGRIYAKYVQVVTETAFARPELLELPEETLQAIAKSDKLQDYHYQLVKLLREKAHTLSKQEEALLASFGEVFAVPKQVADSLMDADMQFGSVKDALGNEQELTGANYILLQTKDDRVLRKNAFESYYKAFREHINTFAAAYSGAVKGAAAEASVRHYANSRAMALASEQVPESVYDNLIAAVHDKMDVMYRYVALRKRLLGVSELHYYDVYAPLLQGSEKEYSYEDAQRIILDTVGILGKDYQETVKSAFSERWIDVYPNKGKSGGAYSSGSYRSKPFILTNFDGSLNAVSTIAHEMGHSMHTWYSNHHQKPQNADYTLFVAEVASTVNENLLIERLLKETEDPKERLFYLNQYLEAFKGTVYRQTMFAEFEQRAHRMAEEGEALSAASLNALYESLIREYFGEELILDEEVQYEWARIPHFYRPFYVFKYATSYSAAVAISEAIRTEGEAAVARYLSFLSMGGSADPIDELKVAGVDLSVREPMDAALQKFAQVVDAAEKAADELGL